MKKAVIVLPTYNEAGNVEKLINEIFSQAKGVTKWQIEILVVDSKSTDGTADIVKSLQKKYPQIHLLLTEKEGLGKAYTRGFSYAIENLNPYLIFEMDADCSHNPENIPQFLKKIEEGADFVIGTRYIKGGSIPKDWGLHRKFFSFFGNLIVRLGFMKLSITDWTGGYRAIKTWVIKKSLSHIKNYSGYVFQIALLDNALNNGANIKETPIHFKERYFGMSKINSVEYIINILIYVFLNSSFVKFVIVGLIGFGVDFSFAYYFINFAHLSKPIANAASAEIAIISNFFLNNFWSFDYKRITGGVRAYARKLIAFNLVSSGSILIQWSGMHLSLSIFGDTANSWIFYKVAIITFIIIPYSYILYNKVIWKKK
jgi:dolichol-phosphate mannosyltransferase